MRAFLAMTCLVIFAVTVTGQFTEAEDIDFAYFLKDDDFNGSYDYEEVAEELTIPTETTEEEACIPRECARMYNPVCVSFDDALISASSECDLNNRLRCALARENSKGLTPVISHLHDGPCSESDEMPFSDY